MIFGIAQTLFYCTRQHTNIFNNIDRTVTNGESNNEPYHHYVMFKMKINREELNTKQWHNNMQSGRNLSCQLLCFSHINLIKTYLLS